MISVFGGYAGMGLRLGAEYDVLTKKNNAESNIISISINYNIMNNIGAFFRYDVYDGDTADDKDNNYLIAGILLDCKNGLSISPNLRMTTYEDAKDPITEYKVNFQLQF